MTDFEVDVVQSTTLGAASLWQVAESHQSVVSRPIELPKLLLVLPIVFNRRSAAVIGRLRLASGLLKAIDDEPLITVGLQQRVQATANRSLRSLSLAIGAGFLLRIEDEHTWPAFESMRRGLPDALKVTTERDRAVLAASKRLGHWFAATTTAHIARMLGVRF